MALCAVIAILLACFSRPLLELVRFSLGDDLCSYIPLIPFVSLYLIWIKRRELGEASPPPRRFAILPLALALGLLGLYGAGSSAGWKCGEADYLALMTLAFLLLVIAACLALVGARALRANAFALAFLVFAVPLPTFVRDAVGGFLQHASADAAQLYFLAAFMPAWREGQSFHLPGMTLEVAPECSGIHSTLVLLITSFLAAHLFLRRSWTRAILVVAVLPLALLRNGFRILVIGELCVHIGPEMIDSYIHRHGGPIFFVLSLIPFFYLLRWLNRFDSSAKASP